MSEVKTLFRHCPACGRRFEIRVVKKEPGKDDSYESRMPSSDTDMIQGMALAPLVLDQGANEPVIVEEKEFSYTYICKHCGHQWKEVREKIRVESSPEGYTGD